MSNKHFCKKPNETRAASKGARKIGKRGAFNRRVVNGWHVTKGRREIKGHDIADTPAGNLLLSFLG